MAEESKIVLEREYIVPLRAGWSKVPEYKRANKAIKTLKEFIAQHMKVYDRDLRKIKVEIILNNEIRFRGMRKPPTRIKVRATKLESGIVEVRLVNIPDHIKFALDREAKKAKEIRVAADSKKSTMDKAKEAMKKPEKTEEEKAEEKEKEQTSKEATQQLEKAKAKEAKHAPKTKETVIHRKALKK